MANQSIASGLLWTFGKDGNLETIKNLSCQPFHVKKRHRILEVLSSLDSTTILLNPLGYAKTHTCQIS